MLLPQRFGEGVPLKASDGERSFFSGSNTDVAGDIRTMRELGVGHLDFSFGGQTVDSALQKMQEFRTQILAKV